MDYIKRESLHNIKAPGRIIQRAFGEDAFISEQNANMGFAHFSLDNGKMKSHMHESEIIYVLDAKDVYTKFGRAEDEMTNKKELKAGDLIRFSQNEWHIFEFNNSEGYLDIIFFFSQGKINVVDGK